MSEPCPKCLLWHRPDRPEWACPATPNLTPDLTPFDLAELVVAPRGSSAAADVARELLRWRPVIEAAQAWRDADGGPPWHVYDDLRDAIDTARAKEGK